MKVDQNRGVQEQRVVPPAVDDCVLVTAEGAVPPVDRQQLLEETQALTTPNVEEQMVSSLLASVRSGSVEDIYHAVNTYGFHPEISTEQFGNSVGAALLELRAGLDDGSVAAQEFRDRVRALLTPSTNYIVRAVTPEVRAEMLFAMSWPFKDATFAEGDRRLAREVDFEVDLLPDYSSFEAQKRAELAAVLASDEELADLMRAAESMPSGENLFALGTRAAALVEAVYELPPTVVVPELDESRLGSSSSDRSEIRLRRDDAAWQQFESPGEAAYQMLDTALHEMRHQVQDKLAARYMQAVLGDEVSPMTEIEKAQGNVFLLGRLVYELDGGYFLYQASSLERDACEFAASILAAAGYLSPQVES